MDNYCIKVKRRGFNYYPGCMERYFENVAVQYGYHLTKRIEQADLWCVTFLGNPQEGGSKWITFTSGVFSNITYEQLEELTRLIGECFKSESVIGATDQELMEATQLAKAFFSLEADFKITNELIRKYGEPELWLFSREHSAFDEPPTITDGETIFQELQYDTFCISGKRFNLCVMNIGGPSKGLTINFCFDNSDEVEIENAFLSIPHNIKNPAWIQLELERGVKDGKITYRSSIPEINIQAGFNQYSSKYRGNKNVELSYMCSLWISFVPKGNWADVMSLKIEIIPDEFPNNKLIFSPRG